jgi:hypothetical protein
MNEGKRPGGLTALAVLNFVFGGFSVLGVLAMAAVLALLGSDAATEAIAESGDEEARKVAEAWEKIGTGLFYGMLALSAATAALLIASGVGYLQQKRFLGRTLGNTYAVLSIASSLLFGLMIHEDAGGGFNIGTILGLVYPVLTLLLLNGTFKEDFIRP